MGSSGQMYKPCLPSIQALHFSPPILFPHFLHFFMHTLSYHRRPLFPTRNETSAQGGQFYLATFKILLTI